MESPNDTGGVKSGGGGIQIPGMKSDTLAVATVIASGAGVLYLLNKGMRGIGEFQLTGSTVGALEWAAYAAVVGGTFRVLQINFPDNKIVQGLAFVY